MLTVDYDRLQVGPGDRVLDLGCGAGRHAYGALRRGADVIALDWSIDEVAVVRDTIAAMDVAGEVPPNARATAVRGDLTALPFPDASFDRVIAAEVLEHIPADGAAMAEIARVVRPGGLVAVTVPRWFPERICWALSDDYHGNPGGHVRIYTRTDLATKLEQAGLRQYGAHHAHGLHAPYWWLKCAVGVHRDHVLPKLYHRMLVWDITARPLATRVAERALNPLIGKSLVLYLRKPEDARVVA
jgi:SAM-dependent methyltransferase